LNVGQNASEIPASNGLAHIKLDSNNLWQANSQDKNIIERGKET
jgi:hypothetical protein